jgi:hypothetical protein
VLQIRLLCVTLLLATVFACSIGGDDDDSDQFDDDSTGALDDSDSSDDDTSASDDTMPDDDTAPDDTTDDSSDDTGADDTVDDDTEDDDDTADDDDDTVPPTLTTVAGDVYKFDPSFSLLSGAEITVVERPDIAPAFSDADGHFIIDNVHAGDELTLLMNHPQFFPTQTATVVPPVEGMTDLMFQTPPNIVAFALALVLWVPLEDDMCQIAVTATEAGGNPFSAGIAGVSVSLDPPVDPESGPFYFQVFHIPDIGMIDIPVRGLTETTDDGGAVFVNVPPGEYILRGEMIDAEFSEALIHCNPGVLVNAAPPYGLQRLNP